jgi:Ca2+:H+ antiporter
LTSPGDCGSCRRGGQPRVDAQVRNAFTENGGVARKILWASLALAPVTLLIDYIASPGDTALFLLAALALVPLAWLIGEATEHAAQHTGPGIGGFLNATFGNAPELIIALLAVNEGLTEVVRGSLTGSVVSNLLLVLGLSLVAGGRGVVDRPSTFVSLGLVALATLLFLVPAVPSWHGDHERHSIEILSIPVSVVLLLTYCGVTAFALRRHRRLHVADEPAEMIAWPLTTSLVVLALATGLTAAIAEILVHSLETFAERAGLTDFFVAAVIVAIVGNAAEHGGAVIVAYRGRIRLAAEIALASSAQVAVFLVPAVALLAWPIEPLGLGFRPVEVISLGIAVVVVAALLADGRSSRTRGAVLVAAYAGIAVAYYLVGDR